jgi:hypothetical protein
MRRCILTGLLGLVVAGCAEDRSCENHKVMNAARSAGDEHERLRRLEMIHKNIEGRFTLRRMGIENPQMPGSDCPRCNDLYEAALARKAGAD